MKIYILLLFIVTSMLFSAANKVVPYKIIKSYTKSSKSDISICFNTDRYFTGINGAKLKPYIRVVPNALYRVKAYYDTICISGLKPETKYTIDLNNNLPLGKVALYKSYRSTITTGDYKPSFSFKESGYVLPLSGDITIPIESRNLKSVEVSLYRINRNNLAKALNEKWLSGSIYYYTLKSIEEQDGYKLWSKKLILSSPKNRKVVTAIPLGSMLKTAKAGLYILAITPINKDGKPDIYNTESQQFILSDIGLFTMQGSRALHIYTKHLKDASVYNNCKLELVSKNNEVLATTVSKNGYAKFNANLLNGVKGMSPKGIYAYGENGDFALLDLSKAPLDLTDRGDGGLEPIVGYNAFLFSNRAIFKPKSSITFHALVKDEDEKVAANLKLSAKLINPAGKVAQKRLFTTDSLGHIEGNFTLPKKVGRYTIKLYASNKNPIGKLSFSVEDFVPPKIEVDVVSKPKELKPQSSATVKLHAKFLTGEDLPNAKASYSLILHTVKSPLKEYNSYYFGDINEFIKREYIDEGKVLSNEHGEISIELKNLKKSPLTKPLSLYLKSDVLDPGGRAVTKSVDIFFNDKEGYIGVKPKFKNNSIDLGSKAKFDIVYISDSKLKREDLEYKLVEQDAHWNWKQNSGGDWEYYRTYEDIGVVKSGKVTTDIKPIELGFNKLDWGSYRLEITDNFNNLTSYRFSSGYEESESKISPDKLPVAIDKKVYRVGDTIKVLIKPKFSGPLIVNIASSKILETKELRATANKPIELEFKSSQKWGSSVYVLATSIRAHSKKLGASRAVGLAHIAIRDPKSYIDLELKYPKKVKSKSKLKVVVSSKNSVSKELNLVVMAVDKGVLNLTQYKTPEPTKYFYGKRKLGVKLRDIYAELIKSYGQHAEFSVGSDAEMPELLNETPTTNRREVLAKISRVVKLDKNGEATVEFDIPDYQGRVELMAVAWSKDGVGSTDGEVVVKDAVSTEIYMPKFLSLNDSAKILLQTKFDKDAPKGEYIFKISTNGVISATPSEIKYSNIDTPLLKTIRFKAIKEGIATIKIEAINSGKIVASREFELATRAALPKSYVNRVGTIDPHIILDTKSITNSQNWQSVEKIRVGVSTAPMLGIKAIKEQLIAYCCRCAEQTTSRGFAFLDDKNQTQLVTNSIERLYDLQKYDGGFGLWSNSKANLWVSSYVMDFLTEAKKRGFMVDSKRIESGLNYLQNSLARWSKESKIAEANAYALYVLAKNKRPMLSDINYHINNTTPAIKSAASWGHLAAALSVLGKSSEAKDIFKIAQKNLNSDYWANYGGKLRDKALLALLAYEAGFKDIAEPLVADLAFDLKDRKYLSTQEMSTLIRASKNIDFKESELKIKVGSKEYSGKEFKNIYSSLNELPNIENLGDKAIWYNITFVATPNIEHIKSIKNRGFSIKKEYFTTDGKQVDLNNIKQGSEIVVVISGKIEDSSVNNPVIVDLLPAGFEIENPNITGFDITTSLNWLKNLSSSENEEYRDDRYICAFNSYRNKNFKFAYAIRAVTKGKYNLAPALINDMYKPQYRAFSLNDNAIEIKDAKDIKENNSSLNSRNSNDTLSSDDYERVYKHKIDSLDRYSTMELDRLRNAIYAQAGLDFKDRNLNLHKLFSNYKWYKPTIKSAYVAYSKLSQFQKENMDKLLNEEKRRLGGLTIADFYRVHAVKLDANMIKHYSKKELKILRNSLIARYGFIFKNKELDSIFRNLPWYKPNKDADTSTIIDKQMNRVQRANLDTILKVEKRLSE